MTMSLSLRKSIFETNFLSQLIFIYQR